MKGKDRLLRSSSCEGKTELEMTGWGGVIKAKETAQAGLSAKGPVVLAAMGRIISGGTPLDFFFL